VFGDCWNKKKMFRELIIRFVFTRKKMFVERKEEGNYENLM